MGRSRPKTSRAHGKHRENRNRTCFTAHERGRFALSRERGLIASVKAEPVPYKLKHIDAMVHRDHLPFTGVSVCAQMQAERVKGGFRFNTMPRTGPDQPIEIPHHTIAAHDKPPNRRVISCDRDGMNQIRRSIGGAYRDVRSAPSVDVCAHHRGRRRWSSDRHHRGNRSHDEIQRHLERDPEEGSAHSAHRATLKFGP